jgi:ribosomal-protein-alanine N-acetyltransferase
MEKMPYRNELETLVIARPNAERPTSVPQAHWRRALPALEGPSVTLRELRSSDALSLYAALATEEVARFISPPPATVEGFQRFVAWTQRERAAGNYICYGIVPRGLNFAVGFIQVRRLDDGFDTAEWGFVLGSEFWGTGVFVESAQLALDFTFDVIGVYRLEARAAVKNGRGNGALRKIGAVQEGMLRNSFLHNGQYLDQLLWTILATDWRTLRVPCGPSIH